MMKDFRWLLGFQLLIFSLFPLATFGQTVSEINNLRSDTIDVKKYSITIDFTNMGNQEISAHCTIDFQSKMNNTSGISLDLLGLIVDSVKQNDALLTFTYNDTLLRVTFSEEMMEGDEDALTVFYHGSPVTDASGFGGFYFQADYAYSIGVGFEAEPHNYGRVWHPCFDNFVERAAYEIQIISPSGKNGVSNGYLADEFIDDNGNTVQKWIMDDEIPSYLASVGVAPYSLVHQTYISNLDGSEIPVLLAAKPNDTTKLKNSFVHLFDAMDAYQLRFGPYRWDKIGYTVVPFNGGAMEHATTIMYPVLTVTGNLQYETLMAHELSHHWWGNLVTCRTAEDMWINEGTAAYSESLFLEHVYDYERYLKNIKSTHLGVIQKAHYLDEGFFPISGVPHNITYGSHTYDKGATLCHNLRTHMGDDDFFQGLKAVQNEYAFKDINAEEFRDVLTNSTNFDATHFFDNYIFNPGFNGFELDSFTVSNQGNNYDVSIFIQQKLFEAPEFFEDVPLQITFMGSNWEEESIVQIVGGEYSSFTITLPFEPVFVYFNKDDGLLNAVTGFEKVITGPTALQSDYAYFFLQPTAEEDSSFVRVDHCRIPPDPIVDPVVNDYFIISPDRYWKVDGVLSNSFQAKGRIVYNAKNSAAGNLDNGLMQDYENIPFHEDSLVLVWRPNQKTEWSQHPAYEIITNNDKTDGYGTINILDLQRGEYTFAIRKRTLSVPIDNKEIPIKIYPNPTQGNLNIQWENMHQKNSIRIYDSLGRMMLKENILSEKTTISTSDFPKGTYTIGFFEGDMNLGNKLFIKK